MTITEADIERWFTYHPPTEEQRAAYERIRESAKAAALASLCAPDSLASRAAIEAFDEAVFVLCPKGFEKSEAGGHCVGAAHGDGDGAPVDEVVFRLRSAVMWANAAIACAPANTTNILDGSPGVSP